MGPDEVEKLIAALSDRFLRRGAIRQLAWFADVRAAGPLIDAVRNDSDPKLIEPAKEGLIRIGEKAVSVLIDAVTDENVVVRELAVEALGEIGDQRAIQPLINTLQNDPNTVVRQTAAESLGKLRSADAVVALIGNLNVENQFLRWAVVEALGKIGDQRAVQPLIDMLNDPSQEVRNALHRSLNELGYKPDV